MSKLYLGGIRSGKSELAERFSLNGRQQNSVAYIATADIRIADTALKKRIHLHQARRNDSDWKLYEAESDLKQTVLTALSLHQRVLIDSVDMWLSALFDNADNSNANYDVFLDWLDGFAPTDREHRLIIVSSEVGFAPIAINETTRRFVDWLGLTNQRIAASCSAVSFCVAGLELPLK